jgi:hypothetical protein
MNHLGEFRAQVARMLRRPLKEGNPLRDAPPAGVGDERGLDEQRTRLDLVQDPPDQQLVHVHRQIHVVVMQEVQHLPLDLRYQHRIPTDLLHFVRLQLGQLHRQH